MDSNKKLEGIVESLKKRGMSESAVSDFLNSIRVAIKKKKLDKLTNDPDYQKILKKYNIKPVDWNSTKDDPFFK
jgi:hypothetical protein